MDYTEAPAETKSLEQDMFVQANSTKLPNRMRKFRVRGPLASWPAFLATMCSSAIVFVILKCSLRLSKHPLKAFRMLGDEDIGCKDEEALLVGLQHVRNIATVN